MADLKVATGTVRLSYARLWEAKADDSGTEYYSTAILIPKTDKATLTKIKNVVNEAKEIGKTEKWGGKIPAKLHTPLRDGDEEEKGEAYQGHYFLNAKSKTKPQIKKVIGKDANGKNKFADITDQTEVYSGCYVKASLTFYPFDTNGNKGIGVGLNGVVKVQDGEPLGGGYVDVAAEFEDEEFEIEILGDDDDDFMN